MSAGLILSINATAGGKGIAPAAVPVIPVATENPWPLYVGVGALMTSLTRDPCPCNPNGPDLDDHRYGIATRIGWDFNNYFGIEGRYLKTFGSDVFSKTEHYGLYLKPQYHISEQSNVYALLGYGKTKVKYDNGVYNYNTNKKYCYVDENDIAYGVGFEYDFKKDDKNPIYAFDRAFDGQGDQETGWGLWVDFQRILTDGGYTHTDVNVVTAGITYDFD
jgi:hypothetical protein